MSDLQYDYLKPESRNANLPFRPNNFVHIFTVTPVVVVVVVAVVVAVVVGGWGWHGYLQQNLCFLSWWIRDFPATRRQERKLT